MASKTSEVEHKYGKPIKEILIDLYTRLGGLDLVARELGVSQGTVSLWIRLAGLEIRYVLVDKEREAYGGNK